MEARWLKWAYFGKIETKAQCFKDRKILFRIDARTLKSNRLNWKKLNSFI